MHCLQNILTNAKLMVNQIIMKATSQLLTISTDVTRSTIRDGTKMFKTFYEMYNREHCRASVSEVTGSICGDMPALGDLVGVSTACWRH